MRFLYVLLVLAAAAVAIDDPARWQHGNGLLAHADWDGVLPGDLVSPVFVFFLGAAVPVNGLKLRPSIWVICAVCLFMAGLAINGLSRAELATWRIPGVLQRAGITLAIATVANSVVSGDSRRRIAVFVSIAMGITLAHWLILSHVPAPGGAPGDLLPSDNLGAWLDRVLLGRHAWSEQWDPDGILSTLSSISTALAGLAAATLVASDSGTTRHMLELAGVGGAAIFVGVVWTLMVPMNRTLWSGSFVVFSAGMAALMLAALTWSDRSR